MLFVPRNRLASALQKGQSGCESDGFNEVCASDR
jgi:hypothetical protein